MLAASCFLQRIQRRIHPYLTSFCLLFNDHHINQVPFSKTCFFQISVCAKFSSVYGYSFYIYIYNTQYIHIINIYIISIFYHLLSIIYPSVCLCMLIAYFFQLLFLNYTCKVFAMQVNICSSYELEVYVLIGRD